MDFIIGHHLLCDHVCIVVHVCMQYGVCNVNIVGSIQYHVYIICAKQYLSMHIFIMLFKSCVCVCMEMNWSTANWQHNKRLEHWFDSPKFPGNTFHLEGFHNLYEMYLCTLYCICMRVCVCVILLYY